MGIWTEFENTVVRMFRFVNGKQVVLWGYERSGWFIEHLFKRNNKQIECIIDDSCTISFKLHLSRSFILREMDKETVAVLLTFEEDKKVKSFLEGLGYIEGKNFIFLRKLFYGDNTKRKLSYYDWLEYKYDVDIINAKGGNEIIKPNDDSRNYAAGMDYPLIDVLDNFEFNANDAFFDFGIGKGNIFPLFTTRIEGGDICKFGGVEYDPELFQIACNNLKKFGFDINGLIKKDASLVTRELDDYNYFFIQNSFEGKTFDKVIQNIQESHDRKIREMVLIYAGTFCHVNV